MGKKTVTSVEAFVAALRPAIRVKDATIPVLRNALLSGDTITSSDLDRTVITKLSCGKLSDTPLLFPIGQVQRVLTGETGDLTIEMADREKNCDRVRFRINGCSYTFDSPSVANFPRVPDAPACEFTFEADGLKKLFQHTAFAMSREESRYALSSLLLTMADGVLQMVATDGHRLAIATHPVEMPGSLRASVHMKAVTWLKANAKGDVQIAQDDTSQFFTTGDSILIARKLAGTFPDYRAVIPTEIVTTAKFTTNPAKRLRSVSFCADYRSAVKWHFLPDGVELSAKSQDGEASAPIECEVSGEPMVIGWNSSYIQDFLRIAGGEFAIGIHGPQHAAIFSTDNFQYIVMPMRF